MGKTIEKKKNTEMKNLKITFLLFIMLGLFNMSYAQEQIKSKR